MATIPREKSFDSSIALLRDGFRFIQKRCQHHHSDVFSTRFVFQPTICLTGEDGARLFYDTSRFIRKGAVPEPIQHTLLGEQSVMTLDDELHRQRKQLFMAILAPDNFRVLLKHMADGWQTATKRWARTNEPVILMEQTQQLLCRAVCDWVGMPLPDREVAHRSRDMARMVDAFGGIGLRHLRGRWARYRTERWARHFIEQVRKGNQLVATGSPAHRIATHREPNEQGKMRHLSAQLAGVELINLIRPTVAISWYITFAALALHEHPAWRHRLQTATDTELGWFANEVRRYYPFAPMTGARVRQAFVWRGFRFPKETLVLLDLYGTNHDTRLWENPDRFWPERFAEHTANSFNFIPQGGGDYLGGHRCAGEALTQEAIKLALRFLTRQITYEVPAQNLGFSLSRMPTHPRSGFVMTNIRLTSAAREER
ncbi:cytochrome P450 [Rudanella paleaurantiibacter]|uniref:Cytochrome P450 n=1 Tax=Rudanella paleaurantiibacter TaxID=2614655 RepID=A0A7J5U446_9BACT|nr:cytochrome P450 [Rudanella paleaurantiibacter]KAB7732535.1 cytochrome P450 [Rudanella paleaurantiibacter]